MGAAVSGDQSIRQRIACCEGASKNEEAANGGEVIRTDAFASVVGSPSLHIGGSGPTGQASQSAAEPALPAAADAERQVKKAPEKAPEPAAKQPAKTPAPKAEEQPKVVEPALVKAVEAKLPEAEAPAPAEKKADAPSLAPAEKQDAPSRVEPKTQPAVDTAMNLVVQEAVPPKKAVEEVPPPAEPPAAAVSPTAPILPGNKAAVPPELADEEFTQRKKTSRRRCFTYSSICAFLCGVAFLLLGLVVPIVMVNQIFKSIESELPLDTMEKFQARMGAQSTSRNASTYLLYNLTNGREVMLGLAKPKFQEIEIKFKSTGRSYDANFSDDNSILTYKSWSKTEVEDVYLDLYDNGVIVTANVQYATLLNSAVGSERNALAAVAPVVVNNLKTLFLDEVAGFPAILKFNSIPDYMQFMKAQLFGRGMAGGLWTASDETIVTYNWGGRGPRATEDLAQLLGYPLAGAFTLAQGQATGLLLAQLYNGLLFDQPFACPTQTDAAILASSWWCQGGIPEEHLAYLWDPAMPLAPVNKTTILLWKELVGCLAAEQLVMPAAKTTCLDLSKPTPQAQLIAILAGLPVAGVPESDRRDRAIATVWLVGVWMAETLAGNALFQVVKGSMLQLGVADAAGAASWSDLGAIQFASGGITQAVFGVPTLLQMPGAAQALPASITVPPEISMFAQEMGAPTVHNGRQLTIAEATAFLEYFAGPPQHPQLLGFLQEAASLTADMAVVAAFLGKYSSLGVYMAAPAAQNVELIAGYLSVYLPTNLWWHGTICGGDLTAYGTCPSNAGLLVKVTPRQFFETGWVDPVVAQFAPNASYNGLMGKQYDSIEDEEASDGYDPEGAIWGMYTGVPDISRINDVAVVGGKTELELRSDLGYSCTSEFTKFRQDGCKIWQNKTVVKGLEDGVMLGPLDRRDVNVFNYEQLSRPEQIIARWEGSLKRVIEFEKVGEEQVLDTRGERYEPVATTMADASVYPANANFHMTHGDGIAPLETMLDGPPLFVSRPYFEGRDDLKECFEGLDGDPKEIYMVIEPLTGAAIAGGLKLQTNVGVSRAMFNSDMHQAYFNATGCEQTYFPFFTVTADARMTDDQEATFSLVYGAFWVAAISLRVLGALAVLALLLGCCLAGAAVKAK
eukprot:TRINITY_DN34000_c0_g1_i1.p1 TRINITY_DN34000_c0_g1~~TRINITY_DN34000_c0_g1_i1.p1  ORF type:complete len:1134 (-),score=241.45 TRINITY_DN34000_c0_g1_i1:215-3616(-)